MKKFLTFVLVLAMVLSVSSVAMALTGSGASADPYLISSADDLKALRDGLNASSISRTANIKLMDNIDLGGENWTPIKSFGGTFDGNGFTISNFKLDSTSSDSGFFSYIGQYPATAKNLTLSDITAIAGVNELGVLAATAHTTVVNNVTVRNVNITTTHKDARVGGFFGYFNWTSLSNSTLENFVVDATNGAQFIGGYASFMDQNDDVGVNNFDVNGFNVIITDTDNDCAVGGFTAQTQTGWRDPFFQNCDIKGIDITASGTVDVGGFIADPGAHTRATNCTTQGKINATGVTDANCSIGGFFADAGWNDNLGDQGGHKLNNCSADVDIITGGAAAGGFIGSATNDKNASMPIAFTNCSASGDVTGTNNAVVGGFAGPADRGIYTNCSAFGAVSGQSYAGGFIGRAVDTTASLKIEIDGCTGSTSVSGAAEKTGGLIGYVDENAPITLRNSDYYIDPIYNPVDKTPAGMTDEGGHEKKDIPVPPAPAPAPTKKSGSGISITYNGGNSFSTSKSAVPTSVEIDGVPVAFNGDGSSFTVSSIPANAKWVTVRWNSTSVTTNFIPNGAHTAEINIPKTGDMPVWAAVAAFFGF